MYLVLAYSVIILRLHKRKGFFELHRNVNLSFYILFRLKMQAGKKVVQSIRLHVPEFLRGPLAHWAAKVDRHFIALVQAILVQICIGNADISKVILFRYLS